ncbi:MAG: YdbC family protein [Bacillota bacterium]
MAEFTFEVKENLGVLSEGARGWAKEFNIVSWNGRKPKFDIREWDETHEKAGKGVTLSKEELLKLKEILDEIDLNEMEMD